MGFQEFIEATKIETLGRDKTESDRAVADRALAWSIAREAILKARSNGNITPTTTYFGPSPDDFETEVEYDPEFPVEHDVDKLPAIIEGRTPYVDVQQEAKVSVVELAIISGAEYAPDEYRVLARLPDVCDKVYAIIPGTEGQSIVYTDGAQSNAATDRELIGLLEIVNRAPELVQ